jgi:serine/threonine protein phosphatase 1
MTGNWKSVLRLEKNTSGRDFACGDIHGCFDGMEKGLKGIGFDRNKDRLFCVGDLIDRGLHSEYADEYIKEPWFFSVLGNHEEMAIMAIIDTEERKKYKMNHCKMNLRKINHCKAHHIENGGKWLYKTKDEKKRKIFSAIDSLPLIIQVGEAVIVHAALPAVKSLEEIEKAPFDFFDTALWHRDSYPPVLIPGIKAVYVGHTPVEKPVRDGKVINIDTGAVFRNGRLTILEIGVEA